ncbi:AhpC/TSA family protein [Aliishimia ponticola]|uniref:AhpC/TSA family protein n=1 Tax=Aliishimia ponticola TaxID=2499833 RepID=A0A4S4ND83_9RHOB|nr:peroxiredoxin-like family protein [Aliishimia ponticola]THH37389.1 AhpC/TSA family protein [Aliishimia ponticola]
MPNVLTAAQPFPVTEVDDLSGGKITLGRPKSHGWQLVIVYRGIHCPICRQYLTDLEPKLPDYADLGVEVVAVSADTEAKARKTVADLDITVPIGFGLTPVQMAAMGLYISDPRSPQETDRPFAEPGLFLINPEGNLHMVDVSNAPYLRPDVVTLPKRLKFVFDNDYPIRGTHEA